MAEVTVLYVEGCGLCTRLAAWLEQRQRIDVAPIGSATGAVLLRDLARSDRYAAVHVVDGFGRRSSGGAAVARLARVLRGGRAVAPVLETFPRLTERAYDLVARNRMLVSKLTRLGPPRCG